MSQRTIDIFNALADPTRRRILEILAAGPLPAGEIARRFRQCRPAISKHLAILKRAGLLREQRQAQRRLYSIEPDALVPVASFLESLRPETMPEPSRMAPRPPAVQTVEKRPTASGSADFELEFD